MSEDDPDSNTGKTKVDFYFLATEDLEERDKVSLEEIKTEGCCYERGSSRLGLKDLKSEGEVFAYRLIIYSSTDGILDITDFINFPASQENL